VKGAVLTAFTAEKVTMDQLTRDDLEV